jgi:hypothetical protein
MFNAINNNVQFEYDVKNEANTNSSKLESEPVHDQSIEPIKQEPVDQNEPIEYESLSKVIKNDFGWREVERLLVIIFYASDFGKADFNREDIISLYKDIGRDSVSRKRNLSNNLQTLLKYKWIIATRSGYFMTDEGFFRARGILARGKAPAYIQN